MGMPRALVTGSAGFVGRHFVRFLRDRGWTVLEIDVREGRDARDFFCAGPPVCTPYDLVLHCAAVVGGRQIIDNAPLAQAVNLELDAGLFSWAAQAQPARVVYFSSSAVYPVRLQERRSRSQLLREDDVEPFTSAMVSRPDQLYGWAKLTGEMLADRARRMGLGVTVVRPFSGYGSDQDDCYPFPAFIDRALAREDPFTVWGTGEQVRDFIHIDDIVSAVMTLAEHEEPGPFNLCSGRAVTLSTLASMVCGAAGYSPQIEHITTAPAGVHHRVGDSRLADRFYTPRIPLPLGIEWALKHRRGVL